MRNYDFLTGMSMFAVRENETFEMAVRESMRSFYIELNPLQGEIVKAVNRFLVIDKETLYRYLVNSGYELSVNCLNEELNRLSQNEYLDKWVFYSADRTVTCKVYRVGRKGRGYLGHLGKEIRMQNYIKQCSPSQIKKILATNRVLVELYGVNAETENVDTIRMVIYKNKLQNPNGKLFRVHGLVWSEDEAIFVEPIRKEKNCEADFLEKLQRMEITLKHKEKCNRYLPDKITVLVLAENETQMNYYMELFSKYRFKRFQLAFSFDRLVMSDEEEKIIRCEPVKSFWERFVA